MHCTRSIATAMLTSSSSDGVPVLSAKLQTRAHTGFSRSAAVSLQHAACKLWRGARRHAPDRAAATWRRVYAINGLHDTTRHDTTRHDTTRHDTPRHATPRQDTTRAHVTHRRETAEVEEGRECNRVCADHSPSRLPGDRSKLELLVRPARADVSSAPAPVKHYRSCTVHTFTHAHARTYTRTRASAPRTRREKLYHRQCSDGLAQARA